MRSNFWPICSWVTTRQDYGGGGRRGVLLTVESWYLSSLLFWVGEDVERGSSKGASASPCPTPPRLYIFHLQTSLSQMLRTKRAKYCFFFALFFSVLGLAFYSNAGGRFTWGAVLVSSDRITFESRGTFNTLTKFNSQ